MHTAAAAAALRFPTPPTSPNANTRQEDSGSKGRSINTERRRSLLVASQLNAALMQQQQQLAQARALQPPDDQESAKSSDALADPEAKGAGEGADSKPDAPAAVTSHALEPQQPIELTSKPLRDAIPRVRKNSWIGSGDDVAAANATITTGSNTVQSISGPTSPAAATAAVSTTVVEPLQSSTLRWHTPPTSPQHASHVTPRIGAHPVFANEQAAAKYSRMLRRASWPMQLTQTDEITGQSDGQAAAADVHTSSSSSHDDHASDPPSYRPTPLSTPACTPKGTATKALSRFTAPKLAEPASSSGEEDEAAHTFETSMDGAFAIPAAAAEAPPAAASSVPALPPSPLVTLLLLGDESCGLGVALDEFAGRDRNIGLTFKTRKVHLPKLHGHSSSRAATQDAEHKQSAEAEENIEEYRVRCWHTPGLRSESIGRGVGRTSLAPYLRSTHAIALVYDVSSEASLAACARWAECLIAHNDAIAAASREGGSAPVKPRPILLVGNNASWTQTRRAAKAGKRGSLSMLPGSKPEAAVASSSSRSARRSSLPHAHTSSDGRETDRDSASEDHDVSRSQVSALLSRLVSAYASAGFGSVSSVSINANGWKDRYRVFHQIAAMVREAGTITHSNANSRPQSPTQRAADEGAAGD